MKTCFTNTRTVMQDKITTDCVITENCKIIYIGKAPANTENMNVVDGEGLYLSPGFVDIHVHGGGSFGVMDCDAESICRMCKTHLLHGTTGILPTALASPISVLQNAALAVKEARQKQKYKTILGIHLEGPFLSPAQKGAQSEESILPVTRESVTELLETWGGIRMIGAAPEIGGIEILAEEAGKRNIALTIAHSDASYDEVMRATELGFSDVTHIYSGCSSVTRKGGFRVAGVVESGLICDSLSVSVIADLCHLPAPLLALIYKCKGADKISLITDALEPAGIDMPEGFCYTQKNGVRAVYEDGVMKLADRSAFAGSAATMDKLVRNVKNSLNIPLYEAVKMASSTPASVIGEKEKGKIAVGCDADLLLFDDDINIKRIFVGGQEVL